MVWASLWQHTIFFNAVNIGSRIGIMKEGSLIHTTETHKITAQELQNLYIKTI